jgi:putative DNA primase/helicase
MSTTTVAQSQSNSQSFDIRDHIFKLTPTEKKDRYYCPVCEGHNFTIKEDTGAYQCWNGCEVADIRNAVAPLKEKSTRTAGRKPIPLACMFKPAPIPKGAKLLVSSQLRDFPRSKTLTSNPPRGAVGEVKQTIYHYSASQWVIRYQWADASKPKGYAKTFRQFHKNADGSIEPNKGERPWKPYRLSEVLAHINDVKVPAVLWGEGEKCVEIARLSEILSITLQGSNWSVKAIKEGLQPIRDASPQCIQVFIADGDETGKKKGEKFEKACAEVGLPCIVIPSTSFEVEGDIEEILQSMDVPEFIKKLEEEIHIAAIESAGKTFSEDLELTASPNEDKDFFIHYANDFFFSKNDWICVNGRLHEYRDNYYAEVPDEYLISKIHRLCYGYAVTNKKGEISYPYANSRSAAEVLKFQKGLVTVPVSEINPPGINCTNGILKIKWEGNTPTFKLIEHNPIHYYTYPPLVEYDPEADSKQCDRLLKCLDPAQQQVFLRNVAASIDLPTVRRIRGREVKALLMSGLGSNGKDALREVVSTIWGHEGMTSCSLADFQSYDDGRKFSLSALRGSRINWASENPQTGRIDKIQSLKLFVTGNKLHAERKGKDHIEFTPTATGLFNVNETPSLQGTLQAIIDRIGVIQFRKTFKKAPDPNNPNEMLADPRFAYDSEFIRSQVAPAFLNKMLQALVDLCSEGIDYSCTMSAFEEMQRQNNHLFQFVGDVGLVESSDGVISTVELYEYLENWYRENGTLTIEDGKKIWCDQARPSDKNVKGLNQVYKRFKELFPSIERSQIDHPVFGAKSKQAALKGIAIAKPNISNAVENSRPIDENSRPTADPLSRPKNPYTAGVADPPDPNSQFVEKKIKIEEKENLQLSNSSNESHKEEVTRQTGSAGSGIPTMTESQGLPTGSATGLPVSTVGLPVSTSKPNHIKENHINVGSTVYPLCGKYQGKKCKVSAILDGAIWAYPISNQLGVPAIQYYANQLSLLAPVEDAPETEEYEVYQPSINWESEEYLENLDD